MSQFEYIAVLISVIAGLGVVHLLRGIARFVTARERVKPYWVHLVWTWNVFNFIVFFWWFVWRWTAVGDWQLLLYFFILIYATCLYLLCAILYPTDNEGDGDFRSVFFENRQAFFILWVFIIVLDIVDTHWKISIGLSSLGITQIAHWVLVILASLVAARARSHAYHAIWGLTFLVTTTYLEFSEFWVLRAD